MPAAPATLKDFVDVIARSQLIAPDELRTALKKISPTGKEAQDIDSLRRALITSKQLTDYQAALLTRGLTEGFFLGPYRIQELIAKGRLAGVYKAVHESGQVVAIKVLPASKARDAETLARFKREARLLTQLDHPHVVRAFHVGETAGTHFLVLEYLDGETLEEALAARKRLPALEAVRIIHQALTGLQHIHERGMIHRDLTPANLMLVGGADSSEKSLKILDIGLGKAVFDEREKSLVDDPSQLTTDGVLIGTPDYLAPEQARSARTADIRSDIYSLGCVLYEALTGQPPFPDKSVLNTVMRHATEPPRPLAGFLPDVPNGLQNVMNWMLAKEPAQRYTTPEKAAQALTLFLRNTAPAKAARPLPAYEKWLAASGERETAKPKPASASIPVGRLESPTRKAETAKPPKPATAAAPLAVPALPIPDVELVPVPTPAVTGIRETNSRGFFEFNARDVIMMVIGALMVVIALSAGWGLNRLLRREPPVPVETAPVENKAPPEG